MHSLPNRDRVVTHRALARCHSGHRQRAGPRGGLAREEGTVSVRSVVTTTLETVTAVPPEQAALVLGGGTLLLAGLLVIGERFHRHH